ncbi:hypothetical protein Tco_0453293 [Tanacetum coccineum]
MHSACSTSENALEKPLDIRKLDNSSYQARGACFKPYKAFLKRKRIFNQKEQKESQKANKSKHRVERAKSKVKPNEETTT